MKLYCFFNIILFFLIIICDEIKTWHSPCELTENPESYEDCTKKSTEYIDEICCYLKASSNKSDEMTGECIDIARDDARNKDTIKMTKERIKNGTYWPNYNNTYDEIEILRCYSKNIFPNIIFMIILFFY